MPSSLTRDSSRRRWLRPVRRSDPARCAHRAPPALHTGRRSRRTRSFTGPARAYRPFGSRCSHTSSGVSTKTSTNSSPASTWMPHPVAVGPVRRDHGHEHDEPGVGHQPRHLAEAANVFGPIGGREPEVRVEAVADLVAVEDGDGHRRCSCSATALAIVDLPEPDSPVNHTVTPTSAVRVADHPAGDCLVRRLVDQYETAGRSVAPIVVGEDGLGGAQHGRPISLSARLVASRSRCIVLMSRR